MMMTAMTIMVVETIVTISRIRELMSHLMMSPLLVVQFMWLT